MYNYMDMPTKRERPFLSFGRCGILPYVHTAPIFVVVVSMFVYEIYDG